MSNEFKVILALFEKIIAGEVKYQPLHFDGLSGNYCPYCNTALTWSHTIMEGSVNEEELYTCGQCPRQFTSSRLFRYHDAWLLTQGIDPLQGRLYFDEEVGQAYTKHVDANFLADCKKRWEAKQNGL